MVMSTEGSFNSPSRPPPPAPPLPPHRYGHRAAHAIARLAHPFLYGSRPSSAQGNRESPVRTQSELRDSVTYSSSSSRSKNVSHKTGIPINALDISPERTHAVFAGRDILKTVRVGDNSCIEDFNLRAHIAAYASAHNSSRDAISAQHRDQLTANDVKWSHKLYNTTIATAASSGRIVIYDVNRPSVEIARLHEHARQVHKLAFNPFQGALLLSASQDGTIRMWDLRELRGERSIRVASSYRKFSGNNDPIRDIRWSPTDVVEFAVGTDSGVVQKWDFRRENAPLLKFNAHEKACHAIDWHPSGRYLASAGADKQVKVWDLKSTDRRMKPITQLRTPQSLLNVRWRRNWNHNDSSSDSAFTTQLATSYITKDSRIHIWDLKRPHVPFQELDRADSPASDMLWHSADRLWSVGSAGNFLQTDVPTIPKPIEKVNVNIVTAAPDGLFCFYSDARLRRRISLTAAEGGFLRHSSNDESSGERLSSEQSGTDGSLDENRHANLPLHMRRQKHAEARSNARAQSVSAREASSRDLIGKETENTGTEFVKLNATFETSQIAASGRILGIFDSAAFRHIAQNMVLPQLEDLISDPDLPSTIKECFERNAVVAAETDQYRLAQTWRIVALATQRALEARKKLAMIRPPPSSPPKSSQEYKSAPTISIKISRDHEHELKPAKTLLQTSLYAESSSNVPTPIARPARDLSVVPFDDASSLDNQSFQPQVPESWSLGPQINEIRVRNGADDPTDESVLIPVSPRSRSLAIPSGSSLKPTSSFLNRSQDSDEQMEQRRSALKDYRGQPRSLLRLDEPIESIERSSLPMRVERHDSNESFQMFSTSYDSDSRSLQGVGSFGESQRSEASEQVSTSLGTSMRQELATSIVARQMALQNEPANTDNFWKEPPKPAAILERKESSGIERVSANAQIHPSVARPTTRLEPIVHNRGGASEEEEEPRTTIEHKKSIYLPNASEDGKSQHEEVPWDLASLLPPLLDYHLEILNDTQFPSILALYIAPLFPSIFSNTLRTVAFIRAYHFQLASLQLHVEAASFRKALFGSWPDVSASLSFGPSKLSFWCPNCRKPVKGSSSIFCTRCMHRSGPCAVCHQHFPPSPEEVMPSLLTNPNKSDIPVIRRGTRWSSCMACGHGGHVSCMRVWWAGSEPGSSTPGGWSGGMCPMDGCGHDCMPGRERERRRVEKAKDPGKVKALVMKDDWVTRESKAVEGARRLVKDGKVTLGTGIRGGAMPRRVRLKEPDVKTGFESER